MAVNTWTSGATFRAGSRGSRPGTQPRRPAPILRWLTLWPRFVKGGDRERSRMSISLLLEMAASSNPDRTAVVSEDVRLTTQQLSDLADGGAGVIARSNAKHVVYVGTGGAMLPLRIFAAARAGLPFTPLNYRLSADGIQTLITRLPDPVVIVDSRYREMLGDASQRLMLTDEFLTAARSSEAADFE